MKFLGLDLGGVNSLVCGRSDAGAEFFQSSAYPDRPAVVLLPMIRKERMVAGDEALRSERGLGLLWPPVAMAQSDGWSRATLPIPGGRLLLATVWQQLVAGGQWEEPKWQPPDGLPALIKPTPAECLSAEALAVLKQANGTANSTQVVLAIPNQLPEESQESLLGRLPLGSRLIWRSVAAAMSWAEENANRIPVGKKLAVMDVGLHGVEISVFELRQQENEGRLFHVPVRRLNQLHSVKTDTLLADNPEPFSRLQPELAPIASQLGEMANFIGSQTDSLICGPLAKPLLALFQQQFSQFASTAWDAKAVARGACLFAWRLARGWPTYLDVLPSLELFTTNRYREPEWFSVIPANLEIAGGQDYARQFPRILAVRSGTGDLENWLRRSNESKLRKHTIKLARVATSEVPVDLQVAARPAGGFARLEVSPTDPRSEIFGDNRHLLLNWLEMQSQDAMPSGFPQGTKFGWPDTGELFGHRPSFQDFLRYGMDYCRDGDIGTLAMLESVATKPTPVTSLDRADHRMGVESGTIPVRSLPCFGSENPCRFFEGGTHTTQDTAVLLRIGGCLWAELKRLGNSNLRPDKRRRLLLIRILGRMGLHGPSVFSDYVAESLKPKMNANLLFAAGRVFHTPTHGSLFLETVRLKAELHHLLTTPWLRVFDYLIFQRPNILASAPKDDLEAAMSLSLGSLQAELEAENFKVKFGLSVRAIARLLRARRHHANFVSSSSETVTERSLAKQIEAALDKCLELLPSGRVANGNRRDKRARLCELTRGWLMTTAQSGVLGPPDEDEGYSEDEGDTES